MFLFFPLTHFSFFRGDGSSAPSRGHGRCRGTQWCERRALLVLMLFLLCVGRSDRCLRLLLLLLLGRRQVRISPAAPRSRLPSSAEGESARVPGRDGVDRRGCDGGRGRSRSCCCVASASGWRGRPAPRRGRGSRRGGCGRSCCCRRCGKGRRRHRRRRRRGASAAAAVPSCRRLCRSCRRHRRHCCCCCLRSFRGSCDSGK